MMLDPAETAKLIIEDNGRRIFEKAKEEILNNNYNRGTIRSALNHFAKITYRYILPVFPALLSLSCEATGVESQKKDPIGAAMAMIAWAADIHDDVIDQSAKKYSVLTIYGKYGTSVSILAGDALLMQGSMLLNRECESLDLPRRRQIQNLVTEALYEISKAEAEEIKLAKKKSDLSPDEFFNILKLKAVVPEVHCKVGSILGLCSQDITETLGSFGRTYGIVSLMLEEFLDLEDYSELNNRLKNECLPLPVLCALQKKEISEKIRSLLENEDFTRRNHRELLKLVMGCESTRNMRQDMSTLVEKEFEKIKPIVESRAKKDLLSLLEIVGKKLF